MKIGILVCDTVDARLSTEFGEYADMIMETLSPHYEFEYKLFDAVSGVLPAVDDECQGYIITGSTHDAYSDQEWIHQLAAWIRVCDEQRKPLVGICFGHQIISLALGGKVEKSHKGWGLGMSVNRLHERQEWMPSGLDKINMLVSHQDQVTKLPPSVTLVASSEFCPNYMIRKENHILTIQGHPEFSVEFERRLLENKREHIDDSLYQKARKSLALTPDSAIIMKWFARFLTQKTASAVSAIHQ